MVHSTVEQQKFKKSPKKFGKAFLIIRKCGENEKKTPKDKVLSHSEGRGEKKISRSVS